MEVISNYYTVNNVLGDLISVANEHGNEDGRVKFINERNSTVTLGLDGEAKALVYLLRHSIKAILNANN